MMKALKALLIVVSCFFAYYFLTWVSADAIFAPAQQTVFFQNDVLAGKIKFETPKVLIVGDSTAAFGYSAGTLPKTLSWASFSSSFAEMYYGLEKYLDKFEAPKCIVLTASYNWAYHRDNRFWDIYVLNGYYSLADLLEIYDTSRVVGDFPAQTYSKAGFLLTSLLYRLHLRGIHMADIQDAILKQNIYRANRKFYRLARVNGGSINKTTRLFPFIWDPQEHLNHEFTPAPLYDEYLKRLVSLASSKNIRIAWLQPPVSKEILTDTAKKFYQSLNDHLRPIIMSDPRNTYDGNPQIYPDRELFSATHLNTYGARRFSREHAAVFEGCQ